MNVLEDRFFRPIAVRFLEKFVDSKKAPLRIFARTACVGDAVLSRSFRKSRIEVAKYQKLRVDLLYSKILSTSSYPSTLSLRDSISNFDIDEHTRSQINQLHFTDIKESFLQSDLGLFDSFCELTDRVFRYQPQMSSSKSTFQLIGHKGDFKTESSGEFLEDSFISINTFHDCWTGILTFQEKQRKQFPIFYLHYSSKNDSRFFYRSRSEGLLEAAKGLANSFSNFHIISLSQSEYLYYEKDLFPYHYSKKTQIALSKQLQTKIKDWGMNTSRYVYRID